MKRRFFAYCPQSGIEFFETEAEAEVFAGDAISDFRDSAWDGGWDEDVTGVRTGVVTHKATPFNIETRPAAVSEDEDGNDEAGEHWDPDCEYKCDYKILPVKKQSPDRLADAPEVEQDLVGWVVVGPDGCMSDIQTDHCHAVDLKSDMDSELPPHHAGPAHEVKPLYLHPQPAPDVAELVDALEEIVQYFGRWAAADHPVATVARKALAAYRQQAGDA